MNIVEGFLKFYVGAGIACALIAALILFVDRDARRRTTLPAGVFWLRVVSGMFGAVVMGPALLAWWLVFGVPVPSLAAAERRARIVAEWEALG